MAAGLGLQSGCWEGMRMLELDTTRHDTRW
jgi:hypothetical protein